MKTRISLLIFSFLLFSSVLANTEDFSDGVTDKDTYVDTNVVTYVVTNAQIHHEFPDIIRVTSSAPVANFEVYSLRIAREAIDQTQTVVSSSIAEQAGLGS